MSYQTDLAGQGIAVVELRPLQYVPATGKLLLNTEFEVIVNGVRGYECGDYLPTRISERGLASYQRMLEALVVNPADVRMRTDGVAPPPARGVSSGTYDYVIITQSSWADDFEPLRVWKTKTGTPATIVTLEWIYNSGGYSGTNIEKIHDFVIDAHDNWGAMYFLLGGDTNVVPYHSRYTTAGSETANIPNDTYLGDYDADWAVEVHVGRAAVRDTTQVANFIDKVVTYELNPPTSNYATTAAMFGFDLDSHGSGEGQLCKQDIIEDYFPGGWNVRTEYDSESGSHKSDVIGYMNQGSHLVNHIDHSSTYSMGAGGVNHGDYLSNSDMAGLYNGDRQGILYSIGCWPCNFPATTCIAEDYVRNPNGGGVAFVGNSRYGWFSPGSSNGSSLRFDRYFFRSLFVYNLTTLGECFSHHKTSAYYSDSYLRWIFTELTLLGDPELEIWTVNPQPMTVTHTDTVLVGEDTLFTVQVRTVGDLPVIGANVCLWKDGEVYDIGYTSLTGTVNLWITPTSVGTMYVTAWRQLYTPCESSAMVVDDPGLREACCLDDGSCVDVLPVNCVSQGGTTQGEGSDCGTADCPQPPQACCFDDGGCQDLPPVDCDYQGGTPWGAGSTCAAVYCPTLNERVVDIGFETAVDPDNVCPGQTFDVAVTLSSLNGDIEDLRLLQFVAEYSSNLTINSVTWDLPISGMGFYALDADLSDPNQVFSAAYSGMTRVPGFIVDLSAAPQTVAVLNVTYQGGDAELDVLGNVALEPDRAVWFRSGFGPVFDYLQSNTNVTGGELNFTQGGCANLHIIDSDPGDGWIDARVPINRDTLGVYGWSTVEVTFDGDASGLTPADFTVTETCVVGECDELGPAVAGVGGAGSSITLTLSRPIDPVAWTTISLVGGDPTDVIRLGYLPADADGSLVANANDIVEVVDAVSGGGELYHYDTDRSSSITANDIVELVDLLNGAGSYEPYYGRSLPPLP